jgi:Core-2/I-Branching enzyme
MAPSIGFVLLTHDRPHQTWRLIGTLNRLFENPPIAWHHDFSKCDLNRTDVPSNISVLQPHVRTGWSRFSVVEATISALRTLYSRVDAPDWFYLLSNSCYPIKPRARILKDLELTDADVHIRCEPIVYQPYMSDWQTRCYRRYCMAMPPVGQEKAGARLGKATFTVLNSLLSSAFVPFSSTFRCFAGEHWFCATRKAARYLISFYDCEPALARHYRRREIFSTIVPEESYYQTVLGNAAGLRINRDNFRYIDWSLGGWHPKTLIVEDLATLTASSAHFARKFDMDVDKDVLDRLDSLIGLR